MNTSSESILEKLAAEAAKIQDLRRRLQKAEQDRAETLLAWQSLCELVGQRHLEIEETSVPTQVTVTVKFHLAADLLMQHRRRLDLIEHVGKVVADELLARLVAADLEVDEIDGRQRLRAIPPPPFGRHLSPPKW